MSYSAVKKLVAGLTAVAVLATSIYVVFRTPQAAEAGNPAQIRQEINILNRYFNTTASTFATSSEIINVDYSKFSGTTTSYLEIVASTSAALSNDVYLRNSAGNTLCSVNIPNPTTSWTLIRSSACNATTTVQDYRLVIGSAAGGVTGIKSARLVVLQGFSDASTTATSTQTQIEIGSYINATTSTATLPAANPKYWTYLSSSWDGSKTFSIDVVYSTGAQLSSSTLYTSGGTYTYVAGVRTSYLQVELWGAGGAGRCSASPQGGGGGGGGAYARSTTTPAAGSSNTLVVAATTTCNTTTSNDSTWNTTEVVADGGTGAGASATGGAGGTTTASTGQVTFAGGNAGNALGTNDTGGGGGGSAGPAGAGSDGQAGQTSVGGHGGLANGSAGTQPNGSGSGIGGVGSSTTDGGNGGGGSFTTSQGGAGGGPGGGGGGGDTTQTGSNANGGRGQARLTETYGKVGIALQEDDGAYGTWTQVAHLGYKAATSSSGRATTTFTPTDGRHYRLVASTTDSGVSYSIFNGKIIVLQTKDSAATSSYPEANRDSDGNHNGARKATGQSFNDVGGVLSSASFYVYKAGSPVGSVYAKLYEHTGTFGGSSSVGNLLATSSAVDVSTFPTSSASQALVKFDFTGSNAITLTNGTAYVIAVDYLGDATNYISVGHDQSSPSAPGVRIVQDNLGAWTSSASFDVCYYVTTAEGTAYTKLEPQYLLANTTLDSGTSLQNYVTKWDSGEWSGVTDTYVHAIDSNAQSSVVEIDTAGGVQVTGSSKTASALQSTSTSMTMPTNQNLDVKATTNNGDVYASRILVQVTFGSTAPPGPSTPVATVFIRDGTFIIRDGEVYVRD